MKESVWDFITSRLPTSPEDAANGIWYEGDDIMCKTEAQADTVADLLEALDDEVLVTTGFFDPEEDARNGETDRLTGWHYVTI